MLAILTGFAIVKLAASYPYDPTFEFGRRAAPNFQPNNYAQNIHPNALSNSFLPSVQPNSYAQGIQPNTPSNSFLSSVQPNSYAQSIHPNIPSNSFLSSVQPNSYAQNIQPNALSNSFLSSVQPNSYAQNILPNTPSNSFSYNSQQNSFAQSNNLDQLLSNNYGQQIIPGANQIQQAIPGNVPNSNIPSNLIMIPGPIYLEPSTIQATLQFANQGSTIDDLMKGILGGNTNGQDLYFPYPGSMQNDASEDPQNADQVNPNTNIFVDEDVDDEILNIAKRSNFRATNQDTQRSLPGSGSQRLQRQQVGVNYGNFNRSLRQNQLSDENEIEAKRLNDLQAETSFKDELRGFKGYQAEDNLN